MNKDFLYLVCQFVLFALFFINIELWTFNIPTWLGYFFLVFVVVGFVIIMLGILHLDDNLTPFPAPKKDSYLISNGIYKHVRHPIYLGILVAMTAYALYEMSVFRLVITALLLVVLYFKTQLEEAYLIERFEAYQDYKKSTGRFLPKWN